MRYENHDSKLNDPAGAAAAVTPSNTTVLPETRGLYVGGTGDVAVVMRSGDAVTFRSVQAGTLIPIRVRQVRATGTTASGIVALR